MDIEHGGDEDMEDDEWPFTEHRPPPCPRCGQPSVPIAYGLPGPGMFDAAERGAVVLGGCSIRSEQPTHQCRAGHQFEAQPPG